MFCWSRKISKNYAFDLSCFHLIRKLKDGLIGFEGKIDFDCYEGNHNPQLTIMLVILNFKLVEINIYNVNHVE